MGKSCRPNLSRECAGPLSALEVQWDRAVVNQEDDQGSRIDGSVGEISGPGSCQGTKAIIEAGRSRRGGFFVLICRTRSDPAGVLRSDSRCGRRGWS